MKLPQLTAYLEQTKRKVKETGEEVGKLTGEFNSFTAALELNGKHESPFTQILNFADPAKKNLQSLSLEYERFNKAVSQNIADPAERWQLLASGAQQYQYKLNQLTIANDKFAVAWERGFSDVDRAVTSVFTNTLSGAELSFKNVRNGFTRMLAEMANTALVRPITISIMGVMGGVLGGSGTAMAQNLLVDKKYAAEQLMTGGNGFGGGLNNATSLMPKSWTSGLFNGITDTINNTMAGWFPGTFAGAGASSLVGSAGASLTTGTLSNSALQMAGTGTYGGMASGGFSGMQTFTGIAGSALGMGALGGLGYSLLGGMIGLPQGKYSGITSSLGGAAGWGLGSLVSGSLAGGGGALAGAAAGSVIPVIGTILGALGGGLLGSLFGSERKTKPSVYTQGVNMPISSQFDYTSHFMGNAWYDRAGAEEASKVMPILGEAAKVSAQQIETLVAALPEEFRGKVEKEIQSAMFDAGPATPGMDKHNWNFQFYDEEQLKERLEQVVKDIQLGMGKVAQEAMNGVDMSSMYNFDLGTSEGMDRAVKAVTSVKEITEATKEIAEPASQLVAQAKAAKKQMEEWTKSMQEYGVVGEYANKVVEAYRQANIDVALKDIADATRQITEPTSQLVQQAEAAKKQMDDWLAAMKEYGANMDEVNAAVAEYQRVSIKANIDAIEASINPLSQYEQSVKAANQSVDDHKTALARLGATETEIARVEGLRAGVIEALTGAMTLAFAQDMRLRAAQISGDEERISSTQLAIQHERELADVRNKFGKGSAQESQILAAQDAERRLLEIQHQRQQIEALQQAIAQAEQAYAQALSGAQSSAQAWVSAAENAFKQAQSAYETEVKSILSVNQQLADSFRSLRESLYLDAKLNPQGTVGAYDAARLQVDDLYAKAMAGDADAARQFNSAAKSFLDLSLASRGEYGDYTKDFYDITGKLDAVEFEAKKRADEAQKQLDALTGIDSTTKKTLDQLKADMDAARAQFDEAQATVETYYRRWGLDRLNPSIEELKTQFFKSVSSLESAERDLNAKLQEAIKLSGGTITGSLDELRKQAEKGLSSTLASLSRLESAIRSMGSAAVAPGGGGGGGALSGWQQSILEQHAAAANAGKFAGYDKGNYTAADVLDAITKAGMSFDQWYSEYGSKYGYSAPSSGGGSSSSGGGSSSGGSSSSGGGGGSSSSGGGSSSSGGKSQWEILQQHANNANAGAFGPGYGTNNSAQDVMNSITNAGMTFDQWYNSYGKQHGYATGGVTVPGMAFEANEGGRREIFMSPVAQGVLSAEDSQRTMEAVISMGKLMSMPAAGSDGDLRAEIRLLREEIKVSRSETYALQRQVIVLLSNIRADTRSIDDLLDDGIVVRTEGGAQ